MPRSRLSSSATLLPSVTALAVRLEGVSSGRIPKQMGAGALDSIAAGGPTTGFARAPSAAVLCAVVVAGLAAAACTVLLALTSDHIPEPGVHAGLAVWGLLGFVLAGVVAWWRRPESRFGILMVLAGTAWFLSTLSSANLAVPYTIGITFDLFPAVVFLHVFLAFPNGRLERPFERALVGGGVRDGVRRPAVRDDARRLRARQSARVVARHERSNRLRSAQLVVLSALCLAGVVSSLPQSEAGRPLRRSLALLVDSFALGLVMIAFLFLSAVFGLVSGEIPFETIRRVTFFVARARAVRLPGRPARRPAGALGGRRPDRRAAGRSDAGGPARRAGARAARPVADARLLAAGVRDARPTSTAGRWSCPADGQRAGDDADRPRRARRWRRSCTTRRSTTSPSCSPRSARRRASRSRTGGCRSSCAPGSRSCGARARG